ncbi:MAG: hypothetical protein KA508_00515 [Gammaproteobacteria bacterium]|nr:hypothetical protein [Gammaproteobacteria bacterium]
MKKPPLNNRLPVFLLKSFKGKCLKNPDVIFSTEISDAVLAEIGQRCTGSVLRYLEREAKLRRMSFTDYFLKKMANNHLLKALGSDLAQLAVVELAKIYADPDEAICPKNFNHVVQESKSNRDPNSHKRFDRS